MYPPIVVSRCLEGERLEAFNQMADALRTLDSIGERDAANALCEAIDLLVGVYQNPEDHEAEFFALMAREDAYSAHVAFRRFLADGGESRIEVRSC